MKDFRPPKAKLRLSKTVKIVPYRGPRPMEELGGKEGVTSIDIAEALQVRHFHIMEKLRRAAFRELCDELKLSIAVFTGQPRNSKENGGRPVQAIAMETRAAKAVLAKWDSPTGRAYLRHLLDCEIVVEKKIPELMDALKVAVEERDKAAALLEGFTKPRIRKFRGQQIVDGWEKIIQTDMFGQTTERLIQRRRPLDSLSAAEREAWATRHRQATMTGISRAQTKAFETLVLVPSAALLPPPKGKDDLQ